MSPVWHEPVSKLIGPQCLFRVKADIGRSSRLAPPPAGCPWSLQASQPIRSKLLHALADVLPCQNAPNSLKLRPCPSRRGQVGFVLGTPIVAISQNPVIEIGVATPQHAVVTNATAKLGRSIANSFQNKRMLASGTTPSRPTTPKLPPGHNPRT